MKYVISVYLTDKSYILNRYSGESKHYVSQIVESLTKKSKRKVQKQIILTDEISEAEEFNSLNAANKYIDELKTINSKVHYDIKEK